MLFQRFIVFITVFPQTCLHNCTCHRSPWDGVNIFDCRNKSLTSLPEIVLHDTDWLLLSGNNFGSLNEAPDYVENITLLNLSSSKITNIDKKMTEVVTQNVKSLDIRGNNLKNLPHAIANENTITKLWLSDNPYECNCDMLWMKDWLAETENIMDKRNITCSTGN